MYFIFSAILPKTGVQYGVRGVSQIKFTMSDSFLVFYDFDILSMIKRKNPFRFYCVNLILNLSRLISQKMLLISKIRRVLISQMTLLISKICRVWFLKRRFWFPKLDAFWFLKWHFWFPKFIAFDFSNDTFDFQNLSPLIFQVPLLISKISLVSQLGVAHLFDEFTRDLWFFCSLLVFSCHVRPRNSWKWYVLSLLCTFTT